MIFFKIKVKWSFSVAPEDLNQDLQFLLILNASKYKHAWFDESQLLQTMHVCLCVCAHQQDILFNQTVSVIHLQNKCPVKRIYCQRSSEVFDQLRDPRVKMGYFGEHSWFVWTTPPAAPGDHPKQEVGTMLLTEQGSSIIALQSQKRMIRCWPTPVWAHVQLMMAVTMQEEDPAGWEQMWESWMSPPPHFCPQLVSFTKLNPTWCNRFGLMVSRQDRTQSVTTISLLW